VGLTSKSAGPARTTPESQLVLSHAIATVAKTIDEKILALPGSRDQLLPAIEFAIAHYEGVIAGIPGPITVSTGRHGSDPVLASMFPSAQDITVGLGRSIAVRNSINWFVENQHERVFAVMGTRQRPGDANTGLTDHTFRSLGASERDARECLCEAAFTSLVNAFASRLKERQREWRQLHADRPSQLGEARTSAVPTPPNSGPSPQQQEIFSRHLDPAGDDLTPQDGLAALIEWLRAPEAQMRIGPHNGQGIGSAATDLPLMSSTDRRHWLVCLTEFSLQDALAAIGQTPAANRYILI
jgi:hypothetical protein